MTVSRPSDVSMIPGQPDRPEGAYGAAARRYQANITAGSLKIAESRVIADLLLHGVDEVGWKQAIVKDNVLKAKNPSTAICLARLIRQRLTMATFVALCSAVLGKPIQTQMVILGSMSLGGNLVPVENLAQSMQVAFDAGGKRILLPMASVTDIPTIPGELFAKFQTSFYADPVDAVFKALGVA